MLEKPQLKRWWIYPRIPADVNAALSVFPDYLRQLLYNRGILDESAAEQYLNASQPTGNPFLLLDMEKAVGRILKAIEKNEVIVVYGDYDVDGVSATALMVQVLQASGARQVKRYIPNRFDEGYGLNSDALQMLSDSGANVIITVDCGIRSVKEADLAKSLGIDLIISDHHYPKEEIKSAYAVICPKREGDPYPDKDLAGVGVAYKIAEALFIRQGKSKNAENWLDLVALGTVADIVPLTGENRVLVRRGINLLRLGQRVGLQALIRISGRDPQRISASDIGYILGPRLNAAGRIDSALQAYDLLMTDSVEEAGSLAQKLDNQNSERQRLTKDTRALAEERIGSATNLNLIASFDPAYSSGIMGLVATNLVETYYRPSIVGMVEAEVTRASCRSIAEFHITQALDKCADLLERHGGHAMAAGFTVKNENMPELMERLQAIADEELAGKELLKTYKADLELPIERVHEIPISVLDRLQPTGMGNADAVFISRNVTLKNARAIGAEKTHLKFTCQAGNYLLDAVAWKQSYWLTDLPGKFDLLYMIEENYYMGNRTMQINVRDMRPSSIES